MKKSILALFAISMTMFAAGETKKVHEKTAKLQKDSYCNVPKEFGEFKKINTKDSRVDVNFEKCVFDGETYENVKVGVLVQDTKKAEKLLKKADEALLAAHNVQTEIIQDEVEGRGIAPTVLFVHSQDHLMTAIEAKTLIEEMIKMCKRIDVLEKKIK